MPQNTGLRIILGLLLALLVYHCWPAVVGFLAFCGAYYLFQQYNKKPPFH